jgi:hypothetical protein
MANRAAYPTDRTGKPAPGAALPIGHITISPRLVNKIDGHREDPGAERIRKQRVAQATRRIRVLGGLGVRNI